MAQAVAGPTSETLETVAPPHGNETLVLRLHKPKNDKKVQWDEAVVDNEHMGKKKSKCCCIYEKPHNPDGDDDGSDSDEEGDHDCCHEHRVARVNVPKHNDSNTS